jgi:hypothetical protein
MWLFTNVKLLVPPLVPVRREVALGELERVVAVVDPVPSPDLRLLHLRSVQRIACLRGDQLLERVERLQHLGILAGGGKPLEVEHRKLHPVGIALVEIPADRVDKCRVHQLGCKGLVGRNQQPPVDISLLLRIKVKIGRQHLPREDHRQEERVVKDGVEEGQPLKRCGEEEVVGQLKRPVLLPGVEVVQRHGNPDRRIVFGGIL